LLLLITHSFSKKKSTIWLFGKLLFLNSTIWQLHFLFTFWLLLVIFLPYLLYLPFSTWMLYSCRQLPDWLHQTIYLVTCFDISLNQKTKKEFQATKSDHIRLWLYSNAQLSSFCSKHACFHSSPQRPYRHSSTTWSAPWIAPSSSKSTSTSPWYSTWTRSSRSCMNNIVNLCMMNNKSYKMKKKKI